MSFNPNAMMKKQFEKMISQRFGSVDNMMNDMSKFAGNNPTLKNIFFATGRITEEQYNELMDVNKEGTESGK